jgi:hypothetical protein
MTFDPASKKDEPMPVVSESAEFSIPLPELPVIPLPQIPELDFGNFAPPPPPKKKTIAYGSKTPGAGPISFLEIQKMPGAQALATDTKNKFHESHSEKTMGGSGSASPASTPPVLKNRVRRPENKPVEPEKPQEESRVALQTPLNERVMEFDDKKSESEGTRVDLQEMRIIHRGVEEKLDPEVGRALQKVQEFFNGEFEVHERLNLEADILQGAINGRSSGELMKLIIAPVIKRGEKRYKIINELLKLKEAVLKKEPDIAAALLQKAVSNL